MSIWFIGFKNVSTQYQIYLLNPNIRIYATKFFKFALKIAAKI